MAQQKDSDFFSSLHFILFPIIMLLLLWFSFGKYGAIVLLKVSPPVFEFAALHIPSPFIPDGIRAKMARFSIELVPLRWENIKHAPWRFTTEMVTLHGYIFRLILIPLFAYFSIRWFFEVPSRLLYKRQLSFLQLAHENADQFPWVLPALKAKVHERDPFKGTWKMPLTDFQFCATNGLLIYKQGTTNELKIPPQDHEFVRLTVPKIRALHAEKIKGVKDLAASKNIDISGLNGFLSSFKYFSLDTNKCDSIMVRQLGKPWTGVDSLPPMERALAICLMGIACGGKHKIEGNKLLNQISKTFVQAEEDQDGNIIGKSEADLSGVNALYHQVKKRPEVRGILGKHAYEYTVLMRLLDRRLGLGARSKGKLSPKRFHWLKPHNEQLWRVLHRVGAQTPWAEGMAAFHHYENEIRVGVKLLQPATQGATYALVKSLYKQQWIYDKELAKEEQEEAAQLLKMLLEADEASKKNGQQKTRQN